MDRDRIMRGALWTTAVFNVGGALMFAFPASLGQRAGLPAPAPPLYTSFIAFMVLLFAATYAWLAMQPRIDRPLVVFSAAGKTGFFVVVLVCFLLGELPARSLLGATGDLGFAALFVWWLLGTPAEVAAPSRRRA
jgi:hypothetical protein